MNDSDLKKCLLEASVEKDGKKILNCHKAFLLSSESDVSLKKIGELCNELKIKIANCQLGCF